jgi:hypothetical protein
MGFQQARSQGSASTYQRFLPGFGFLQARDQEDTPIRAFTGRACVSLSWRSFAALCRALVGAVYLAVRVAVLKAFGHL